MARSGFKMKGSPMARNFGIGASPVRKDGAGYADTVGSSKATKPTYQQAWDNMSDTQKTEHGSFANFKAAAEKYNEENA